MAPIEFHKQLVNLETSLEKFAHRLTSEKADAKDLLQETYLKVLSNQDKYVNHVNFKAWTFTIMKNTFINNYRRNVRHSTTLDSTKNLYFLNQSRKVEEIGPDSNFSANEISKIIDSLDDELKIPFKLMLEGYKYKEIADKLELKLGTVKSRIFFTRKRLMELLSEVQHM